MNDAWITFLCYFFENIILNQITLNKHSIMLLEERLFITLTEPWQNIREALRILNVFCFEAEPVEKHWSVLQDTNEHRHSSSLIAHADRVAGRLFGPWPGCDLQEGRFNTSQPPFPQKASQRRKTCLNRIQLLLFFFTSYSANCTFLVAKIAVCLFKISSSLKIQNLSFQKWMISALHKLQGLLLWPVPS